MKKYKKGFIVPVLLAIIASLLIGGGIYIYENKKSEVTNEVGRQQSDQTQQNSPIQNTTSTPKATPPASSVVKWTTYTNLKHFYTLNYPADTKITSIDRSSDPSSCVLVKRGFGYIQIASGSSDPCAPTGVGIGDSKVTENVTIGNKQYEAIGFVNPDKSFSFLSFSFADKIYVTYGVNSDKKVLSVEEYQKNINSVKDILATLKSTPVAVSTKTNLTAQQIENAQIPFNKRNIQLSNGSFVGSDEGYSILATKGFKWIGLGDINADGNGDAVAVIAVYCGGAGTCNTELATWINQSGVPKFVNSISIGYRPTINSIYIHENQIISVDMYPSDTSDSQYPNQSRKTVNYKLSNGQLVEVN